MNEIPQRVVLLVHGIRDFGEWESALQQELQEHGIESLPIKTGYIDEFRFLAPVPFFRNAAVKKLAKRVREAQSRYPGARFSFVAHSFGSYLVARMLLEEATFKAERIIFCGSPLSRDFPLSQLRCNFEPPILNEVGKKDIWPSLASTATWGYGDVGSTGFGVAWVHDRYHDLSHGGFLTADFARKYWVPFLLDGTIVPGDLPTRPDWRTKALRLFPLKYAALFVLTAVLGFWLWQRPDLNCDGKWLSALAYRDCFNAMIDEYKPSNLEGRRSWFGTGSDEFRADWTERTGDECVFTMRNVLRSKVDEANVALIEFGYVPVSVQSFVNDQKEQRFQAIWSLATYDPCPALPSM